MKDPPDQTAEFNAENLLSLTGTILLKYSLKNSGYFFRAASVDSKITPCFSRASCTDLYTTSDSYCALVAVKLCRALAQYYTDVQRSNLSMDLVDQSKNAALYAARAEEKYKEYRRLARLSDTPKKYAASWAKVNKPRFTIFPDSMR